MITTSGSLIKAKQYRPAIFSHLIWLSGKTFHLWSGRFGFESESGQTNDLKIAIYCFPAWCSTLKGQSGEQARVLLGKAITGIPPC